MRLEAREGAFPTGAVLGAIGLVAGVAVALFHLDRLPWPLCTFRALTGFPCLTCGSTRALGRLAALDVRGALLLQPLATAGILTLAGWALTDLLLWTRGRALDLRCTGREARWLWLAAIVLALVNWAYLILTLR